MNWLGTRPGHLCAHGLRGFFTIDSAATGHTLKAVGHDDMPLIELPYDGARYTTLQHAKDAAGVLDGRVYVEAQVGGE